MKIEINVKQKTKNKEKYIYVENIKMHQRKALPYEYLNSKESVHKHNGYIYYYQSDMIVSQRFLCEGVTYPKEYFEEKLKIIKRCAKNLHKINLTLTENLKPSWNNVERAITI